MKRLLSLTLTVLAALSLPADATAQIRSLSFGIGLNCPFGLGECYPQVYAGLVGLPGAELVAEEPNAEHNTCIVRPAGGRMLAPREVAKFIEGIRIGARLRGMEATVDGRIEKRGADFVLVAPDGDVFRLVPLETKVQWDFRSKSPFPVRPVEAGAHARLTAQWVEDRRPLRVIGPVVQSDGRTELTLQVREFYAFGARDDSVLRELRLGIRVNSPYGLTEPWATMRSTVEQLPGIAAVGGAPDLATSTVEVRLEKAAQVDVATWAKSIQSTGDGAQLFGIEATVSGRVAKRLGQLALQPTGTDTWMYLTPLTRNVKWDYRKKREILPTDVEHNAYAALLERWTPHLPPVHVAGPLVLRGEDSGDVSVLEVRAWGLLNELASESAARRDFSAPDAPKTLRAKVKKDSQNVQLTWARNREKDFAGYHVYRSADLEGPYTRVTQEPVRERTMTLSKNRFELADWFFVTALDQSGNESPRSMPASPLPPAAPSRLKLTLRDGAAVLTWKENTEADFDSYTIYRAHEKRGPFGEIASVIYDETYTNFGLQPGRTYHFVVTAVDGSFNESVHSEVVSVTLPKAAAATATASGKTAAARTARR